MNKIIMLFCLLTISFSDSCSQQKSNAGNSKKTVNILFIGNSLTYSNNLPELVTKNAKLEGIKISTKMIAFPNYAIIDHWNEGEVQKLIASKKFDYVIIQQGPSSQAEGRNMLIEDGKKYSDLCKLNNTKFCYFMVWPSLNYYHTFDDVIKNHTDAAAINNSVLLPVGEVWKDYFDRTKDFKYYSADGFHPSLEGSEIASKVIIEHLFKD